MGDLKRRLDKLARELGEQHERYAPLGVTTIVWTQQWRDGEDDAGLAINRTALREAQQVTVDQIVEWVIRDALQHCWAEPYYLVIGFQDETQPQLAHFTVPWRPEGHGDAIQQVLGLVSGDHQLHWPEVADAAGE